MVPIWKTFFQFHKMLITNLLYNLVHSLIGIISKWNKNLCLQKKVYTKVQKSIVQKEKQFKYLPTDEWINDIWYFHTMECYSAIIWNEVLMYITTQIDSDTILLNERTQSCKTMYYVENRQIHKNRR